MAIKEELKRFEKLQKNVKKKFKEYYLEELEPWMSEQTLCSTMNIIADEENLPLRFEIVWTDDECWIFAFIKWFGDVYIWKFSNLSAEWVATTVWNMIQERNRLQYIADRWNNSNLVEW